MLSVWFWRLLFWYLFIVLYCLRLFCLCVVFFLTSFMSNCQYDRTMDLRNDICMYVCMSSLITGICMTCMVICLGVQIVTCCSRVLPWLKAMHHIHTYYCDLTCVPYTFTNWLWILIVQNLSHAQTETHCALPKLHTDSSRPAIFKLTAWWCKTQHSLMAAWPTSVIQWHSR